jgi:exopolysaccharide biosynthesis polyprenyl glycosylphosphotransferase
MKRSDISFGVARVGVDFILLSAAALAAYALRVSELVSDIRPVGFEMSVVEFAPLAFSVSVLLVGVMALSGAYSMRTAPSALREFSLVAITVSLGMMSLIVLLFLSLTAFDSRFITVVGWIFAILFVCAGRLGLRKLRSFLLRTYGIGRTNVLLIGSGEEMDKAKRYLSALGGKSVALAGEMPVPYRDLIERVIASRPVDRILMVNSYQQREEIVRVIALCEERGIQFSYVPDVFGSLLVEMDFDVARGIAVVSLRPTPLDGWGSVGKRVMDVCGVLILSIVFAPIFLAIAFAIKWESKGPVFVRLTRVSRGKEFRLLKFRSMIDNAHELKPLLAPHNERADGPLFKMADDPRITRVGAFLRKRRLDEFPQLINILRGEMSLVGPRPHEPQEVAQYGEQHKKVFAVKAGVTGFAQVNGAQDLAFEEEVKLDRYYIEHWSLRRDIAILLKTVWILLFSPTGV